MNKQKGLNDMKCEIVNNKTLKVTGGLSGEDVILAISKKSIKKHKYDEHDLCIVMSAIASRLDDQEE